MSESNCDRVGNLLATVKLLLIVSLIFIRTAINLHRTSANKTLVKASLRFRITYVFYKA